MLTSRLPRQLTRNTAFKLSSELIGRLASFGLMILAARQLGEAGFGIYNYGLALGFVLAQLADMGLQLLIAREVAIHGARARPVVRLAFHLKVGLSGIVIAALVVILANQPAAIRLSGLLLGLVQLSQTYLEFVAYIYRGQQALGQEAWLLGGARLVTAVTGSIILWQGGQVWQLAAGSLGVVVGFTLLGMGRLRRAGWLQALGRRAPAAEVNAAAASYTALLRQAAPLGMAIFLSIAYTRLAVLLLQRQMGETAVAHFSAAARLVEPMQLLPASLIAAAFPVISVTIGQNPRQAKRLGARISLLLGGCGLVLAAGFWLAADWFIPWLYGDAFAPAARLLQLLGLTLIPAFINYSLTHYLIAWKQQVFITLFMGTMLALHLLLSWLLIPQMGPAGPALSMLVAEGFLLLACLLRLSSLIKPPRIARISRI